MFRPLRPGDIIKVERGFPRRRLDEDAIDFLRVHYDTDASGLGHVVEVRDDGMVIELWGHLFSTQKRADAPDIRRLTWVERLFAPQRLGEAILRWEARKGRVVMTSYRPPRQPLTQSWLRQTRGTLPVLAALGGRIHLPLVRKAKSRLHCYLGQLGIMPPLNGFLDHGLLVDRIGATIGLSYNGRNRMVWLDHILLHKNRSIHLVGIDQASGEQRTFRLDRVIALSVPPLGEVDTDDLYWELQALCMSRSGWLWYWNRNQARHGRPPAPPIGPVGRMLSWIGSALVATVGAPAALRHSLVTAWGTLGQRWRKLGSDIAKRWRVWQAARQLSSRQALRRAEMPTWRRRLLMAIATVEAGGQEQITCLLPMNALLADAANSLAFLRYLLEVTLEEAQADSSGHPQAPELLAEALAMAPTAPRPIPLAERQAARALALRIYLLQPGHRRIWVHASRRAGADARLLLCECFLAAVYHTWGEDDPWYDARWDETAVRAPLQWAFYRTIAHYVARWDDLRFRVDAMSAPRLRAILDWWDAALAP